MSDAPALDVRNMPGIDFRQLRPCDHCKNPLTGKPGHGETRHLDFYRVRVAQAIVNVRAVQSFAGLAMMFAGNEALADVFAPERHAAKLLPERDWLLCFDCFTQLPGWMVEPGEARP